ncbi:DUF4440 domain-containing protein [Streptomyces sp. NPDC090025]|uniref:nuclear transport factor 2 family protein n=1 Tax=Streptomyces sp. NPDC090025 TaxID=3365922 RepID=UPI0038396753
MIDSSEGTVRRAGTGVDRAGQEAAIAAAIDGELRLLDPAVRGSATEAARFFDPEFVEVGASGRRWTYEEMLAALPGLDGGAAEGPRFEVSSLRGVLLAPDLVHLTYETRFGDRKARRSSIWRRAAEPGEAESAARVGVDGWRLYYHQGTPFGDD